MSMTEWAKHEIELACKNEGTYGSLCYKSALKAFNSLKRDSHTGTSIGYTKLILNRLLDGKPLTPIVDTPEMWARVKYSDADENKVFQCIRMSSLFKEVLPDGTVMYRDNDRCYCINRDDSTAPGWYSSFISKLINEKYPIEMPYFPAAEPFVVYCTEGLSDPSNGDFDTIGVWSVLKPDGERDTIERFFKETDHGFEEISYEEYCSRVGDTYETTRKND